MLKDIKELIKAHEKVEREVYLDLENGAPVPKEVVEAMLPYFNEIAYGNPIVTHKQGWMAYEAIQTALEKMAGYVGATSPEEVNFTPGEVEANNLAIIGVSLANREKGKKIVISEIEPLSIIFAADLLAKHGFKVVKAPVDREGFVNLEKLEELVDRETVLVSISLVNAEIGTVEPVKEAVEVVKDKNPAVLFHSDASDAYGRMEVDVKKLGVDLLTLSSNKILGPRGIAALYVKEGVKVERLVEGPMATQKLWPGVENIPLIMGFLKASELALKNLEDNVAHMKRLRDRLINTILETIPRTLLNGPMGDSRAPDNVNISFLGCEGEALIIELSLKGVYVSGGTACLRRAPQPSHVLTAIGRKFEESSSSILMKVSRYHTDEDIEYVLKVLPEAVERLRSISPL